ncbi:MAG: GNAT family N-acetyltransferase [Flavobacteriaceae bacterium]
MRPTTVSDAAFIVALWNTPKWIRFIGDRNVKTIAIAREYITEKMIPQLQKLGYSSYTVLRKEDHRKIGSCSLYDREGLDGIDIGFAFLPAYEGKGYALEAASKLRDVALTVFGLEYLMAITTKDNVASQKLLRKLGLKHIGTTQLPNETEELLVYKLGT